MCPDDVTEQRSLMNNKEALQQTDKSVLEHRRSVVKSAEEGKITAE